MELLCNGDRLEEHAGRFSDEGSYATTHFIVLDYRTTHPGAHICILIPILGP